MLKQGCTFCLETTYILVKGSELLSLNGSVVVEEVQDLARWYGPRRRYRLRPPVPRILVSVFAVSVVIILIVYVFSIIDKNLSPAIMSIAEARAHHLASEAINKAIYDKVLADVTYNDLVIIHKDSQQRITLMQANSVRIGRIISQANLEIKETLRYLADETLRIPLGQTLGTRILANTGPRISVRISPVGTVDVKIGDEFQQAGINQVRHILYLNIHTTVKIVVPTLTEEVSVRNSIPIAETIIVGEVPSTFFGLGSDLTQKLIGE